MPRFVLPGSAIVLIAYACTAFAQTAPPLALKINGWSLRGNTGEMGTSIAAGDIDGDGFEDLVAGSPGCYTKVSNLDNDYGQVVVYRGSTNGLVIGVGAMNWYCRVTGPALNGGFGWYLDVGDVNDDDVDDILISAPSDGSSGQYSGKVYLYRGRYRATLSATPAWTYTEPGSFAGVGRAVLLSDLNGDGCDDAVVSVSPLFSGTRRLLVFYSRRGSLPATPDWTLTFVNGPGETDTGFATGLAGADVNGDGIKDLIIGSPYEAVPDQNVGKVYVFLGSATGLKPNPSEGNSDNLLTGIGGFGYSVAAAGHVNADTYEDVVVGQPGSTGVAAYLYFGDATGLSLRQKLEPGIAWDPMYWSDYGWAVAGAGRFNDDPYDDVVVTDRFGAAEGKAFVFYGSTNAQYTGMAKAFEVAYTAGTRTETSAHYGDSVVFGRFHGDAGGDLAVGAGWEGYDGRSGNGLGAVYVYYGAAIPLSPTPRTPREGPLLLIR